MVRLMRRSPVHHHHTRGLQVHLLLNLLGESRHNQGANGVADEREGRTFDAATFGMLLQGGFQCQEGVLCDSIQARERLLSIPGAMGRPLVDSHLHELWHILGQHRPGVPIVASAVEDKDSHGDLGSRLQVQTFIIFLESRRHRVVVRQPEVPRDWRQVIHRFRVGLRPGIRSLRLFQVVRKEFAQIPLLIWGPKACWACARVVILRLLRSFLHNAAYSHIGVRVLPRAVQGDLHCSTPVRKGIAILL
mmetsp:Transcript_86174/g.184705  ORF Transcript_86174/g.184705 Transcript_86174/m.184705 type:complete len:248 (-) Transcript_86174:1930-2673(-)